jgi:hypothetical protein
MKLAFTISDAGHFVHTGGQVTTTTHIVDVPDDRIPAAVKHYLDSHKNAACYWSMAVSVIETPEQPPDSPVE